MTLIQSLPSSALVLALVTMLPACPSAEEATTATDTHGSMDGTTEAMTAAPDPTDGEGSSGTTGAPAEPPASCGAIQHFATGKEPTRVLHVSLEGSDVPACGASDAPCASIMAAVKAATPGTAVQVHAGTYSTQEVLSNLAGTADAPIWIGGAPGEARPVFTGYPGGMHLSRVRYLVLHDVEFSGAIDNIDPWLVIDDGGAREDPEATRFVALEHLAIDSIKSFGIPCVEFAGVNDFWILDSEFQCTGEGVRAIGSRRGLIAGNNFPKVGDGLSTPGGSMDIEFRGNRVFAGNYGAVLGGFIVFERFRPPVLEGPNVGARNISAVANLFVGGIASLDFSGCVDCLAANNTIIDPFWLFGISTGNWGKSLEYTFEKTTNARLTNNIFVFHTDSADFDYVFRRNKATADADRASFVLQSNLWYAVDDPAASSPLLGGVPLQEVDGISGIDPRLVDVDGGDAHLAAGSPARASGAPLSVLSGDADGFCFGDPPNRGAFAWP